MSGEMNAHDAWRDHAALYALDALDGRERTEFERHLRTCAACAAEVQSLRPVVDALAQAVPQHDPSPALRDRVMAGAGAPASTSHIANGVPSDRRAAAAGTATSAMWWLAAAAMVSVVVGLGIHAASLRARVSGLEADLQNAIDRLAESQRLVDMAQVRLASTQTHIDVLMAPDTTRIDLAGLPAAPDASGRAYWSRSRGVVFSAANLPPLRPNRTYQLWFLTGAGGAPVSAGLVQPDGSGRVIASFETPAALTASNGFAVSEEPAGGVPQPTGELYLAGTAD